MPASIREIVGVYHADGGVMGELRYVLGKARGTAHCALCDITHSTVRRKAAWDEACRTFPHPIRLVHLNERSPEEVKFLMGFNRDVIRRRRDEMNELGVRVRWAGRRKRLWKSVIDELETAEEMTKTNSTLTLTMCVNYGGRAEIADAAHKIADDVRAKRLDPDKITERTIAKYLDEPDMPDVDLFVRSSGEQRTSNFLIWQSAYAEMVFLDTLWPDFDRRHLWHACEIYASRDRRYGGAVPNAPGE